MSGIFDKVRRTTGLGLNENELYERAFTKGVLLHDFKKAADIFQDAARKFSESDNQAMAAQASANAMLYHYLATGQTNNLSVLIQTLSGLQQIESISNTPGLMTLQAALHNFNLLDKQVVSLPALLTKTMAERAMKAYTNQHQSELKVTTVRTIGVIYLPAAAIQWN